MWGSFRVSVLKIDTLQYHHHNSHSTFNSISSSNTKMHCRNTSHHIYFTSNSQNKFPPPTGKSQTNHKQNETFSYRQSPSHPPQPRRLFTSHHITHTCRMAHGNHTARSQGCHAAADTTTLLLLRTVVFAVSGYVWRLPAFKVSLTGDRLGEEGVWEGERKSVVGQR